MSKQKAKVIGNYVLKEQIGKGNFGFVYKGYKQKTKEVVAVKMIPRENVSKPKQMEMLEKEIDFLKNIKHDNIISLYDVQKTDRNIYLILEYCGGGDLAHYVTKYGSIPEEQAIKWLKQLVEGMKELWNKKILHRDLKLANILLTEESPNGLIKIADFGLARVLQENEMATTYAGTPLNMAPEILEQERYDFKADIWSIGTVFYHMLYGEVPIKASSIPEMIKKQRNNVLAFPNSKQVSEECKDLLRQILVYDVKKRIDVQSFLNHPFFSVSSNNATLNTEVSQNSLINQLEEDMGNSKGWDLINEIDEEKQPSNGLSQYQKALSQALPACQIIMEMSKDLSRSQQNLECFALSLKVLQILTKIFCKYQKQVKANKNLQVYIQAKQLLDESKVFCLNLMSQLDAEYSGVKLMKQEPNSQQNTTDLADRLIFHYAIRLAGNGANEEFLQQHQQSQEMYQKAYLLLECLLNNFKGSAESADIKKLDTFLQELNKRIQKVNKA